MSLLLLLLELLVQRHDLCHKLLLYVGLTGSPQHLNNMQPRPAPCLLLLLDDQHSVFACVQQVGNNRMHSILVQCASSLGGDTSSSTQEQQGSAQQRCEAV